MTIEIFTANTDAEIESCFPVFSALRPHLEKSIHQAGRAKARPLCQPLGLLDNLLSVHTMYS